MKRNTGPGAGRREWIRPGLAALLTMVAVALLVLLPEYRARVEPGLRQLSHVGDYVKTEPHQFRLELLGKPYRVAHRMEETTFEDAVILISHDPRDGPLSSLLWCAYYLYPRTLIQVSAFEENPDLAVDFVLLTPNFSWPSHHEVPEPVLAPYSERARRHAAETWGR